MEPSLRRSVYALLIVTATAGMLSRVVGLRTPDSRSPTPFFSANDRSRWATIRALVDEGTYAVDRIVFDAQGRPARGWHTIDLVRHVGADGKLHYYSSKPTLLPTLLAGAYWLIQKATGATLADQPGYVARLMLVLTNVLPLAGALGLLARRVETLVASDAARLFTVAAACFGTFLTTFAVTLNNHLVAAISLVVGIELVWPLVGEHAAGKGWRGFAAGLAIGFVAANELPALVLVVLVAVSLLWYAPGAALRGYLPGAGLVAVAAIGTNWLAHGDWRPPYAHRQDGPVVTQTEAAGAHHLDAGALPPEMIIRIHAAGLNLASQPVVEVRRPGQRWMLWDPTTGIQLAVVRTVREGKEVLEVRQWDHWYDYPDSYWQPERLRGVDRGEASPWHYAFHCLVGHHGLFSLTPLWLWSAYGCGLWLAQGDARQRHLAMWTALASLIVLGFYLTRPQLDRNYGGVTCCLRWLIWLTPLWLLMLLPAAQRLWRGRWGWVVGLALLALSVFSAAYGESNPWSHPWVYEYLVALGWLTP
jgi:hypothetical protein